MNQPSTRARAIVAVVLVGAISGCTPSLKPTVPSMIGSEHFTSTVRRGPDISKDEYVSFYGSLIESLGVAKGDLTVEIALGNAGSTITVVTVLQRTGSQTRDALLKTSFPETQFNSQIVSGRTVLSGSPSDGSARPIAAFATADSAYIVDAASEAMLGSIVAAFP